MPRIPDRIGKYRVVERIAEGGMGAVFKAEHPTLDRYIIIKKLTLRGNAAVRERFRREAQIMMDFNSDHICGVYDHFRIGSSYHIVLEYVDGMSLEQLIRRERYLPEDLALRIFADCCRALEYAHERGVVHRDIKPANILISNDGMVKLVDFGIASIRDAEEEGLTREGATLGTPSYMSPEQYEDSRSVDRRTDVYAMGVVLYEMVTGKKPYPGSMSAEAMRLIQMGSYPPPRRINPKLSPAVASIIRKSMRVKPKRRYQSVSALLHAATCLGRGQPMQSRSVIASYLAGKPLPRTRRRQGGLLIAAAAVVALALGTAGIYVYDRGYHHEVLNRSDTGAMEVNVRVPKTAKPAELIYVETMLFVDDDNRIPPVENVKLRFTADPLQETADYLVLRSNRVYLPSGSYRLKLAVEQNLHWQSVLLRPLSVDKLTSVHAEVPPPHPGPLTVEYEIRDIVSGRPVETPAEVAVQLRGVWIPLERALSAGLSTGTTHRLRFQVDGFYPKEYNLLVAPFQARLYLEPKLTPLPGSILFDSAETGVRILIDGEPYYIRGGPTVEVAPVPPMESGRAVELELPAGSYRLEAVYRRTRSNGLNVTIIPKVKMTVFVRYDDERQALSLVAGPGAVEEESSRRFLRP